MKPLRPHQTKAVDRVLAHFRRAERAQVIMPCGTGKTRVAQTVFEKTPKARTCVVLVPSLTLIRQTIESWERDAAHAFVSLLVCSDNEIAADEQAQDFGGRARTTDRKTIASFIKNTKGRRVIVCTYHSAPLLRGMAFDLLVFDEAHRTAGHKDKVFGFALLDENVRARRRLFMTATPRIVVDDDAEDSHSMDDESIYGPRVFEMAFAEAVDLGVLVDFRVIGLAVTSSELRQMLRETKTKKRAQDAKAFDPRAAAARYVYEDARKRWGFTRTLSFHSSIARAEAFASSIKGARAVSSRQSPDVVRATLDRFIRDGGLVSNCKLLTEGVDFPEADSVLVVDAKTSVVDIVQMIGRVMRVSPKTNKTAAYVLLPIVVEMDEAGEIDEAASRRGFTGLRRVLAALRAHDETIVSEMNAATRADKEGGAGPGATSEEGCRVTVTSVGSLHRTHRVDSMLQNYARAVVLGLDGSWWTSYEKLRRYVATNGRVPSEGAIATWARAQRGRRTNPQLPPLDDRQVAALERLPSWQWEARTERWSSQLRRVADFVKHHAREPRQKAKEHSESELGHWLSRQRASRGRLSESQKHALEAIPGWVWEPRGERWMSAFDSLVAFQRKHQRLPYSPRDPFLGTWRVKQCIDFRAGRLAPPRVALLESVPGWTWDRFEELWQKGYDEVCQAVNKAGSIPATRWVVAQRQAFKDGRLSSEREAMLRAVPGWSFDPFEERWMTNYADLVRRVAAGASIPGQKDGALGVWCAVQKKAFHRKKMTASRARLLSQVSGWEWSRSRV